VIGGGVKTGSYYGTFIDSILFYKVDSAADPDSIFYALVERLAIGSLDSDEWLSTYFGFSFFSGKLYPVAAAVCLA
jgi:hypothetical protein